MWTHDGLSSLWQVCSSQTSCNFAISYTKKGDLTYCANNIEQLHISASSAVFRDTAARLQDLPCGPHNKMF